MHGNDRRFNDGKSLIRTVLAAIIVMAIGATGNSIYLIKQLEQQTRFLDKRLTNIEDLVQVRLNELDVMYAKKDEVYQVITLMIDPIKSDISEIKGYLRERRNKMFMQ